MTSVLWTQQEIVEAHVPVACFFPTIYKLRNVGKKVLNFLVISILACIIHSSDNLSMCPSRHFLFFSIFLSP